MWTVSSIQLHPKGLIVCDEDSTLELHVKVTLYKGIDDGGKVDLPRSLSLYRRSNTSSRLNMSIKSWLVPKTWGYKVSDK
jgi:hypothetical protein